MAVKYGWPSPFNCDAKTLKPQKYYVRKVTQDMPVESVLDVGTGLKGVGAEHYWNVSKHIEQGYAIDIWSGPKADGRWKPIKDDVFNIRRYLDKVDVIQAFGFLEHLEKKQGYCFLELAEDLAQKLVMVSVAHWILIGRNMGMRITCDKGPMLFALDYKKHGNPYHTYKSSWSWLEFQQLGYETNIEDAFNGNSFSDEVIAWKRL